MWPTRLHAPRPGVAVCSSTSVNDLYRVMASSAGFSDPPVRAPARAGELLRSVLDPGRAGIHLGWKSWTTVEEGTAQALRWFASQKTR